MVLTLVLVCVAIGTVSYAASILPLYLPLSLGNMKLVSTIGTGSLVGTALALVIPEAVHTLYNSSVTTNLSEYVGVALLLGFVFMYTADHVPHVIHAYTFLHRVDISSIRLSFRSAPSSAPASLLTGHAGAAQPLDTPQARARGVTTGLVIHALTDGLALAAACKAGKVALQLILLVAIAIHKIPAAFGLSMALSREGLGVAQIKKHVGIFAAATPAGAIASYAVISIPWVPRAHLDWYTGVLLLFSAGTFLYVALHAMQELARETDDVSEGVAAPVLVILGMFIPVLALLAPDVD